MTYLEKKKFEWNASAEQAFNHLKKAMSTALVLALPNFAKPIILETDAYGEVWW